MSNYGKNWMKALPSVKDCQTMEELLQVAGLDYKVTSEPQIYINALGQYIESEEFDHVFITYADGSKSAPIASAKGRHTALSPSVVAEYFITPLFNEGAQVLRAGSVAGGVYTVFQVKLNDYTLNGQAWEAYMLLVDSPAQLAQLHAKFVFRNKATGAGFVMPCAYKTKHSLRLSNRLQTLQEMLSFAKGETKKACQAFAIAESLRLSADEALELVKKYFGKSGKKGETKQSAEVVSGILSTYNANNGTTLNALINAASVYFSHNTGFKAQKDATKFEAHEMDLKHVLSPIAGNLDKVSDMLFAETNGKLSHYVMQAAGESFIDVEAEIISERLLLTDGTPQSMTLAVIPK